MKTGNSVDKPERIAYKNGKAQVRYNITPVVIEQPDGTSDEQYQYNYIYTPTPVTRKGIIDALIRDRHDVNDEFALLALDHTSAEYLAYREFVAVCKAIADEVMLDV